jgi:hypothetical protein
MLLWQSWLSTALSQMSILTAGSSPGRGMRLNLPIAIDPLRRTDTGFQPPAAYLGDEQMLRILGRGHSVPTVTDLILVRAQCLTNFAIKAFCTSRGTITGSSYCSARSAIQLLFREKCKMLLWQSWLSTALSHPLLHPRVSRFNIYILQHDGRKIISCRSGMIIVLKILLTILSSSTSAHALSQSLPLV